MKTLNFEQMTNVNGGLTAFEKFVCDSVASSIGGVYGAAFGAFFGGPIGMLAALSIGYGLSSVFC